MLSDREWDELIAVMKERRIAGLTANGTMTDALIARIAELGDETTRLLIDGPFTNAGLASLAGLAGVGGLHLRSYYAGLTQITDKSLEILGRVTSLEQIELYECLHVTDAGLVFLSTLPRLRQFDVSSSPGVTLNGTRVFPSRVTVHYST
jgi:hypothetical protein